MSERLACDSAQIPTPSLAELMYADGFSDLVEGASGSCFENAVIEILAECRGSDSNGAKSHVKGRCWDRLASQDLSPSVSQGTIRRYVAVDGRLGYA